MTTRKIYISPSSQANTGIGSYGLESYRMQQLSDRLKANLKAAGHTVYGGDSTMTLDARIAASNASGAALHIALHSNAGGVTGTETWYYTNSTNGSRFAGLVQAEVMAITPSRPNRGKKASTTYLELKNTTAVTALVEVGFHDNMTDATWIINNMDELAAAICTAIGKY